MGQVENSPVQWLRSFFSIPRHENLPVAASPNLIINAALMVFSFAAYLIGPVATEEQLRSSFLFIFFLAALLVGLHFFKKALASWLVGPMTTFIVFWLATLWESPSLLNLLVIPVIFAAVAANIPAVLLTASIQSAMISTAWWNGLVLTPEPQFLLGAVWLVAIMAAVSHAIISEVLYHATSDFNRLQSQLSESRFHQQKLSQALDDLEHANRQLSLLYDKNISLRRIAEEATEAKSTYIAKVSHEIRTPLNMILGITESIIENREEYGDDLPLDLEDDIRIIRRNSEHLLSLVNDVLDLTRAESSQMNLRKEWVDIDQEIEKSFDIVMPLAKKKNLALSFHRNGGCPPVFCDRTRVRQVILNLLSNAVRYTDRGEISVFTHVEENWLRIQVCDTGPGIHAADIERIFEPFYRGSSSSHQETLGTGLGLSVSRQIIELHGGKIDVVSSVGEGSTFAFSLPLLREPEYTRSPARFINEQWAWVERKGAHSYNFLTPQKKRVLICAPEENFISTQIELEDQVEFVWVDSLEMLVEQVHHLPAHMIIINETDPEVLMALILRASAKIKDTPIIGSNFSFPREKIARSGAMEYVQKPFANQQLRDVVARVNPYPQRIMIVDDNTEVQRLVARVLLQQNDTTEILLAETGERAWALISRKTPDLILLDLMLPDIDGWQFLRKLKTHPQWSRIPVILVSACDLDDSPPHAQVIVFANGNGVAIHQFSKLLASNLNL